MNRMMQGEGAMSGEIYVWGGLCWIGGVSPVVEGKVGMHGEARMDDLSYLVNARGSRSRSWGSCVLDDIMMLRICYSVSVTYWLGKTSLLRGKICCINLMNTRSRPKSYIQWNYKLGIDNKTTMYIL